ncbi:MAG TPA: hypothetical protein VGB30_05230 [bacterium]
MRTALPALAAIVLFSFFIISPIIAQEGPDEMESNDTMDLADEIDSLYFEGEIGYRNDQDDWFLLGSDLTGSNFEVTLTYDDDRCDIDLEVYSGDEYVGSLTSSSSPDSDEFHVPHECYIHVYIYEGSGEYQIEINPAGRGRDRDRDSNRNRNGSCEGADEVEPNDDQDSADYISGLEINGYACSEDDDWYYLDGQEGEYPSITLRYDDNDCDIDLEVYNDDWYTGGLSSTESPDSDNFSVDGVCYIHVYAYDGEGDYTVEITPGDRPYRDDEYCEGRDEVEPNDSKNQADWTDELEIEGFSCEGDSDWYVLDGQEGTRAEITLRYNDRDCDLDLEIYTDDGYMGSLTGTESPDSAEFDFHGTTYINVYAYEGEGEYTVEISPSSSHNGDRDRDHRSDGCEGPDENEPNDEYGDRDYIREEVWEGYVCEDDTDWFLLDGFEGSRPEITLRYNDEEVDVDLEVWSDDEIVGSLTGSTSPDSDIFRVEGECWIRVYSYSGEGWYEIEVNP